jgi:hypothetical protein
MFGVMNRIETNLAREEKVEERRKKKGKFRKVMN